MAADGFDRAPLDGLTRTAPADPMALAAALAGHPLTQAFLYRVRLESVRRMAAVDGRLSIPGTSP